MFSTVVIRSPESGEGFDGQVGDGSAYGSFGTSKGILGTLGVAG
jgi:hypothetical protein